jgi:hypothetical protein
MPLAHYKGTLRLFLARSDSLPMVTPLAAASGDSPIPFSSPRFASVSERMRLALRLIFKTIGERRMKGYTGNMNQLIDTHSAVKELVASGMPEVQAEVLVLFQARIFDERAATKDDIEQVKSAFKHELDLFKHDVDSNFNAVKKDIDGLRTEVKKDIDGLRTEVKKDMENLSNTITIRFGAMLVAAIGALAILQAL